MELAAPLRRHGALDREPCELVAERDRVATGLEHPGGDALVEMARILGERRLEQPELGPRGHERSALEQAAGRRRESCGSCEHGVANRRRQGVTAGSEELCDEERVPAGEGEDRGAVGRMRRGKPADGLG